MRILQKSAIIMSRLLRAEIHVCKCTCIVVSCGRKGMKGKIMSRFKRRSFEVEAFPYEPGKGMEDGFMPWTQVVTNGFVTQDKLIRIERPDGSIMCPFIQNRRGIVFLREGDYIIEEENFEKHVCGVDKFEKRFEKL